MLKPSHELRCRIATALAIAVLFILPEAARPATADDLDTALSAAARAASTTDLLRLAASAPSYNTPFVREGLAYIAATKSLDEDFARDPKVTFEAVKLLSFATLLELASHGAITRWPAGEALDGLGPASLAQLQERGNFAAAARDPVLPLLRRWPAITDSTGDGDYRAIRLDIHPLGRSLLLERADTPWRDLGPAWKSSESPLLQSRDQDIPVEGLSFTIPLHGVRLLVTAAKAYLALDLLPPDGPLGKYALVLAGSSFYSLSQASGSTESHQFALSATEILGSAVERFRKQPVQAGTYLAEIVASRAVAARFFARDFQGSLESYEAVARDSRRSHSVRTAATLGAAICRLALDASPAVALRPALDLLRANSAGGAQLRYVAASLVEILGTESALPSEEERKLWLPVLAAWTGRVDSEGNRYFWNLDLLRTLLTIDRPDLAVRLLLREIGRIHALEGANLRVAEHDYLRELGASLSDAYSHLSWHLDAEGQVQQRTAGVDGNLDFAPTRFDQMLKGEASFRYGSLSPEEDRASTLTLYGAQAQAAVAAVRDLHPLVLGKSDSASASQPSEGSPKAFAHWVLQELARTPPNWEPLLKLLWVEWCHSPLAVFGVERVDLADWSYRPANASGLTGRADLDARFTSARAQLSPEHIVIWELFRDVHDFLEKTYPAREPERRPPG